MAQVIWDTLHTFNPLNAELNPICRLLALLGAHLIFHFSGLRVKHECNNFLHVSFRGRTTPTKECKIIFFYFFICGMTQQMHNYFTNCHIPTCFDTMVSSSDSLLSIPCQVTQVCPMQLLVIQFILKMFHISLICYNSVTTQNVWFFRRNFYMFWSSIIFYECNDDTAALQRRVLQITLWHCTR